MRLCSSRIILAWMLVAAVLSSAVNAVSACDLCCARCGVAEAHTKVCRLVSVEKKLTETCWSCETEDFCLPGPSKPTCRHCDIACEDPTTPGHCGHGYWHKYFMWSEWAPCGCGRVATKKKLMRRTVTKTVSSYKWVVEDLCADCEAECDMVTVPKEVLIPPPPAVDGAKILGGHTPAQRK
jgi:hypothetical protein